MSPEIPPEAEVIRLAREAMDMTAQDAAEASRARDGKGVSAAYWRDVERGHGGRRGRQVPTRASARALAAMARVVGVVPAQLAGAGREDAARVLAEILRREGRAAPALAVAPSSPVTAEDLIREALDDPLFDMAPVMKRMTEEHMDEIAVLVADALTRNPDVKIPSGEEVFGKGSYEGRRWDKLAELGRDRHPGKGYERGHMLELAALARAKDDERREGHGGNEAAVRLIRT
jgi:hypothetical protein